MKEPLVHLAQVYKERAKFWRRVGDIRPLQPRPVALPEAVVRVVVGQMLSGAAARTIFERLTETAARKSTEVWRLSATQMRACGVSHNKCRTIVEFRKHYRRDPEGIEQWRRLPAEACQREITALWGLGDWTAAIIRLSYLGDEDVFPHSDGSIRTALRLLDGQYPSRQKKYRGPLDPARCRPYRSYLALALWKALDEGVLERR